MPEQILPIKWPFGGLSETFSYSDQEQGTAREYQNVRGLDPSTGRLRGGQRSGLSKYLSSALKASNKVQDLVSFFQDNRQVEYTAASSGSETETWDEATPGGGDCRNIKIDRQGNRYALSGNSGIVKFSSDGQQVWQLALPVDDTNHIVRALAIGSDDLIYAGVSEGGDQEKAKLFCFEQLPDNKTEKLWEIKPGAYVEDMAISQGKLYTCQNRPDRKKGHVRIYEFIDSANPEVAKEWRCPYPVNSIAVKKDGSVVLACQADGDASYLYWRSPDPKYPESYPDSVDWTPMKLDNADRRIWAWFKGDDIDQTDVVTDIADGAEIARWRDSSKNFRHLSAPYDDAQDDTGPTLAMDGYLEHKAVRFSQPDNFAAPQNPPFQALRSLPNSSTSKTFADHQRTLLPGYDGSAFAVYLVCRPSSTDQSGSSTTPRWVFGQDRDNAASGSKDHILFVNASSASSGLPPTASSGRVFWYTGETASSGGDGTSAGQIKEGRLDIRNDGSTNPDGTTTNEGQLTIISMILDGAVSGMTLGSLFSINGSPIDKFAARAQLTLRPTYVGIWRSTQGSDTNPQTGAEGYLGDILEILVLDRKDRSDATANVLTFDEIQFNDTAQSQTNNEHTRIIGYLAHKYGAQANLPYGTAAVGNYPHPYGITGSGQDRLSGPPNQAGTAVSSAQALANKRFACTVKYSAEGKIKWCANEMELDGSSNRTGGYGFAVAVNSDGNIYSVGPAPTGTGSDDDAQVRLIVDEGDTFSIATADGAWSTAYPSNYNQTYAYPRIDVDEFDNLYLPFPANSGSVAGFRVYKKDGTLLHDGTTGAETASYCIAADKKIPDYRSDLSTKRAEFVVVGTNQAEIDLPNVHNIRLVNSAQTGDPPRSLTLMGAAGGDIVKFTSSGVTTPTGGSSALDSASYVQSTALFKKVYFTDGRQYREYSPVTNEVIQYKCTSAGSMPSKCSLIESWRGRIVLARSSDEPHNWFLSKKDEPNNWDFFPPVPSEVDAVAGNNSPAGLCPDIINSVIPYSEDVLVFGGDHSIWMLDGDPAAGGRLAMVSDITGVAFGRPWCKDPNGILYFFGSNGGVYRWVPGSRPERISLNKIERQLQDEVNLSTHYIRLVYNHQDEGIHIFQMPFGNGGTQVSHWFLELKTGAFARDRFGTSTWTNVQPTAAMVLDGDAYDDRGILIGCEDGYVRFWDRDAKSDDTRTDGLTKLAIDSYFTIFPLPGISEEASAIETQFSGLTVVLSESQAGARYELFASEEPESIGTARRTGELKPGRNPPKWDRVVGPYCGVRIRNASQEERWAYERGFIRVTPAGMSRPRSL